MLTSTEYGIRYETWKLGGHAPLLSRTLSLGEITEEEAHQKLAEYVERAQLTGYTKNEYGPFTGKETNHRNHQLLNRVQETEQWHEKELQL